MSVAKRISEDRARFGSHRTRGGGSVALALDDLAAPVGRRRRPGDDQAPVADAVGKLSSTRGSSRNDIRGPFDRVVIGRASIQIQLSEVVAAHAGARILTLPWSPPSPIARAGSVKANRCLASGRVRLGARTCRRRGGTDRRKRDGLSYPA
jgi:hypothetical protein